MKERSKVRSGGQGGLISEFLSLAGVEVTKYIFKLIGEMSAPFFISDI